MKFIPKLWAERADKKACQRQEYRLLEIITIMAVKLQIFGSETCHFHVKVDHAGDGNNRQK